MSEWTTAQLVAADKKHIWHPFTDMHAWCAADHEPLVLTRGKGALLWDSDGREYIDGNSSIWTNIHGHNHPRINEALHRQLERVGHTSFLGFSNAPAIQLAHRLCRLVVPTGLTRVFYSDNGSTGVEVALRIAQQYWRLQGEARNIFVSFAAAYHGDTAGAASLGSSRMFGNASDRLMPPVRFVRGTDELMSLTSTEARKVAAVVIEPLVQGAAGVKLWPSNMLRKLREWCDASGSLMVLDEVMTGFGRTGKMFAFEHEKDACPDLLVLGKGLTGGYVPLAATLTTETVFAKFSERSGVENVLFYGHSYCGHALGCAAALASLTIFEEEQTLRRLEPLIVQLADELKAVRSFKEVKEVRQCGFIAGIELFSQGVPGRIAALVCVAARRYGLLTRAVRDVIVLMPPLCISSAQLSKATAAIHQAIIDSCQVEQRDL